MEHTKSYYNAVALLFYEIGKSKYEFDQKIAMLKNLCKKSLYNGANLGVRLELSNIESDLEEFHTRVKAHIDSVNFELSSQVLDEFKFRINECESLLFKALRSNTVCDYCHKCSNNTCEEDV